MDQRNKPLVPAELSLAAFLSGGLTVVLSVTYTVLSILALVYRFQCDSGLITNSTGSSYFLDTVYRVYIQQNSCDNADAASPSTVDLTDPDTIFIFVLCIMILSVFSCAAAIVLIVVVADEKKARYIFPTVWVHVGICSSVLVVDFVLAIFLGLDYGKITDLLGNSTPGIILNYRNDVLRLGALMFMTVALKGYFAHVVNVILLILLGVYATKYKDKLHTDEHSIHKMGALNAYELQKREDAWQQQQAEADVPFARGRQLNPGFVPDEEPRRSPRSPVRPMPLTPVSDYSNNRDYDRSDSWHHSGGNARPFSYMEEPRRPPARPAPSTTESQWRRELAPPADQPWRRDQWSPTPPVPAPDYSPPSSRRLKSAMKSNYM